MTTFRLRGLSRALGLNPRRRAAPDAAEPPILIVQDGLVAEWRFDEGAGTTLTDYSGNGHHGTFGAGGAAPTWTPQSLSFDGGDYVTVPNFNPSGDAMTVWFVISNPSTSGDEFPFCHGDFNTGFSWFVGYGSGGHNYRVGVSDDGTQAAGHNIDKEHVEDYADNTWRALAFTYSGTALLLYANNSLLSTSGAGTANGLFDAPGDMLIGALFVGAPLVHFAGDIAYLTINEGVMTSEQMAAQYAALQAIMAARGITLP